MIIQTKEKVDSIFKDFEAFIIEAERVEAWNKQLDAREAKLKNFLLDLASREKELQVDILGVKEQKKYILRKLAEIVLKEKNQSDEWGKIAKAKVILEELGRKEQELDNKILLITEKQAQATELDAKIDNIKKREAAIEKERIVATRRKELLDIQEMAIKREQERLQRLAVSMNV